MAMALNNKEYLCVDQSTRGLELASVEVDGAEAFSNEYISNLLAPVLKTNVFTVASLRDSISEAKRNFALSSAAFEAVAVEVTSSDDLKGTELGTKLRVNLTPSIVNKLQLTSHTNNEGANLLFGYGNNNLYGNGENLSVVGSINNEISNGYLHFDFLAPLKRFPSASFAVNGTLAKDVLYRSSSKSVSEGEYVKQFAVGVVKNWFLPKTTVLVSSFKGLGITQNEFLQDTLSVSAKTSVLSYVKLQKLHTISDVFFPVNGFSFKFLQENTKFFPNNDRKFLKLVFSNDSYFTLDRNNLFTFNHSSSFGNLHHFQSSQVHQADKFTYESLFASNRSVNTAALFPGGASRALNEKISGNTFLSNTFRIFTKIPVFHQYIPDTQSILRLQFYLNSSRIFDNFATFQKNILDTLNTRNVSSIVSNYSNNIGVGLYYRSAFASVDLGYSLPLSEHSSASYKPGFQFSASTSVAWF